jgi:hypothetical protein
VGSRGGGCWSLAPRSRPPEEAAAAAAPAGSRAAGSPAGGPVTLWRTPLPLPRNTTLLLSALLRLWPSPLPWPSTRAPLAPTPPKGSDAVRLLGERAAAAAANSAADDAPLLASSLLTLNIQSSPGSVPNARCPRTACNINNTGVG